MYKLKGKEYWVIMASINYVFKRSEKKYLLDVEQYREISKRIKAFMTADKYGLSTICNIYYDTESFELIRRSIDKPCYKEKLRVRSYGVPRENDLVFVEIKKKYNGIVYKRRVSMVLSEAVDYLENRNRPKAENQIFREIDYFINYYNPRPAVYLAYDRLAYYGNVDNNVRVTFDTNIRSRSYDLSLAAGDYGEKLLKEGQYLMEIKIAGAMPMWMVEILSDMKLYPTTFSKYGNIYAKSIAAIS